VALLAASVAGVNESTCVRSGWRGWSVARSMLALRQRAQVPPHNSARGEGGHSRAREYSHAHAAAGCASTTPISRDGVRSGTTAGEHVRGGLFVVAVEEALRRCGSTSTAPRMTRFCCVRGRDGGLPCSPHRGRILRDVRRRGATSARSGLLALCAVQTARQEAGTRQRAVGPPDAVACTYHIDTSPLRVVAVGALLVALACFWLPPEAYVYCCIE